MAQYPVPQFIEREKRLIGPLTVRQSIILGVATLALILVFVLFPFFIFFIAVVVIGSSAISLAFIRVNGMPLGDLLFSLIGFFFKPRTYVWKREQEKQTRIPKLPGLSGRGQARPVAKTEHTAKNVPPAAEEINEIAKWLDEQ